MSPDQPTPAQIRARLAGVVPGVRRSATIGRVRGDHDGNPGMPMPGEALRPAAVLVPLVERPEGLSVLLTQRTAHLNDHAGQISFPGGRFESDDADAAACALREAEEEIGLGRDRVEVIGRLDTYLIRTGFEVTPVVGLVTPPVELRPDPFEVDEIFQVPLAFVIDPRNRERRSRDVNGTQRDFWAIPYGNYFIWGATAGMLVNLSDVLLDVS
jgi:8-oxo-dGTP pyrophosphatase MutT (NUDIX family)